MWGVSKRECLPGRAVGKRVLVGAFAWMGGSNEGYLKLIVVMDSPGWASLATYCAGKGRSGKKDFLL